jgi:hypothetical protein
VTVGRMTKQGIEFKVGDEEVETPDGTGTIIDLDLSRGLVQVLLEDGYETHWYEWKDIEL